MTSRGEGSWGSRNWGLREGLWRDNIGTETCLSDEMEWASLARSGRSCFRQRAQRIQRPWGRKDLDSFQRIGRPAWHEGRLQRWSGAREVGSVDHRRASVFYWTLSAGGPHKENSLLQESVVLRLRSPGLKRLHHLQSWDPLSVKGSEITQRKIDAHGLR